MNDGNIRKLFDSVGESLGRLGELESTYKAHKQQINDEVAADLRRLAVLSDSQAIRAQVVRELYWNREISSELISDAFGLRVGEIRRIAGALTVYIPCDYGCGNTVKKTFTGRSQMDSEEQSRRRMKKHSDSPYDVCDECRKRRDEEKSTAHLNQMRALRQRNEMLRHMTWEDFLDTDEWVGIRNEALQLARFQCEICGLNGVNLHVFLGKDTPQDVPEYHRGGYGYFVVCGGCVHRCRDLIAEDKGELVRKQLMREIRTQSNGYFYGTNR